MQCSTGRRKPLAMMRALARPKFETRKWLAQNESLPPVVATHLVL